MGSVGWHIRIIWPAKPKKLRMNWLLVEVCLIVPACLFRTPMLPTHRAPSAGESLSRLSKGGNPLSKPILRFLVLGCGIVLGLWFIGPFFADFHWGPPGPPPELEYNFDHGPPDVHSGSGPHRPATSEDQAIWSTRRDQVREAFKYAWTGYKTIAYPADELFPVSGGKSNKYNGWGVTLFDSLDTMWIMGLEDEFASAVASVKDLKFAPTKPDHYAPFFETTIRYLGGILSAYALSKDNTLKRLAEELGDLLIPAFRGTVSGLPAYSVNVKTGEILADASKDTVLFAEMTSCQLEFKYLAKITGKKEYYDRVQATMDLVYKANVTDGLFQEHWLVKDGAPAGTHFTVGANADSGYEYLLKQWLLSGDVQARDQYIKSANGIISNLIYITPKRGLLYVGDLNRGYFNHRLEHLSCYLPGVLAMGASLLENYLTTEEIELHNWAAHGLAYTCAISYADQKSGLGPDEIRISTEGAKWVDEVAKWKANNRQGRVPGTSEPPPEKEPVDREYLNGYPNAYLLRPETVEAIFYLWRTTGDVAWRARGYGIFLAIEKYARTQYGFSTVHAIDSDSVAQMDDMPSWFLAETLKYLYLLFDDVDHIPIDKWVFNTEAHPLPVFIWSQAEKISFGIP